MKLGLIPTLRCLRYTEEILHGESELVVKEDGLLGQ